MNRSNLRLLLILGLLALGAPTRAEQAPVVLRSVSISPSVLTLPTGGFHYDPLITVIDTNGQAVWLDLADFEASFSDPKVATVDQRVRITTGRAGEAVMTLRHRKQPEVSVQLRLNTVDETVTEIRVKGETDFVLPIGGNAPVEVEALLSGGSVLPHAEYSADLEVLQGGEYATFVDGLGLVALRPTSGAIPITVGFFQRGAAGPATLSAREVALINLEFRLGGLTGEPLSLPSRHWPLLEVLGIYEDGSRQLLQHGTDYSLDLTGELSSQVDGLSNPYLFSPLPGQQGRLQVRLIGATARKSSRKVFSVGLKTIEATQPHAFRAGFAHYPEDPRLLVAPDGSGYCRELELLVDFPKLSAYRLSAMDSVVLTASATETIALGRSKSGWPVLEARRGGLDEMMRLQLPTGLSSNLGVCSGTARSLKIGHLGAHRDGRLSLELGKTTGFTTQIDYGDGRGYVVRTLDYPVVEAGEASLTRAFWHPSPNSSNFLLVDPGREVIVLESVDARRFPLEGRNGPCRLELEVLRQSGLSPP